MAHHGHSIGSIVIHCIIVFGVIGIALAILNDISKP